MSENKQLSCGVCHAYLFEDDDVVYCPVCGAPHHRDCYAAIGHCAFEEAHGTENQYRKPDAQESAQTDSKLKENVCRICGGRYPQNESRCPDCGAPNFDNEGAPFPQLDFLGGVPENTDLGESVTAAEARRFVFTNTRRYIPKFEQMKSGRKIGWNWFAFLFPPAWFLSRKMYAEGIVTGVLSICFSLFLFPFGQIVSQYAATNYSELAQMLAADMANISRSVLYLCLAGIVLQLLLRVFSGLFGDKIYRDHAIHTISDIKKNSDDIDYDYRKKGGTNFVLLLLGFFAVEYIPGIIFSLFK